MKRKPWIMVFGPDGGNMERMVMSFQRHGSNVRKVIPAAWAEPLNALDYAFGGVLPQDGSVDFSAAACRGLESHRLQSPSSAGFADLAEGPLPWNQEADTVYLPYHFQTSCTEVSISEAHYTFQSQAGKRQLSIYLFELRVYVPKCFGNVPVNQISLCKCTKLDWVLVS